MKAFQNNLDRSKEEPMQREKDGTILKMLAIKPNLSFIFVLIGFSAILCFIALAYLDSIGYWGYPKDFLLALFVNRGSEPIGLGIQGLQMFHYLIGSAFTLAAGIFLSIGMPMSSNSNRILRKLRIQTTSNLEIEKP